MAVLVPVLALLLAVWVHKAGHALAYRDLRIGRAVVRYGAPMGPRHISQPTQERPWGVVVTPWLVTGHVQPDVTGDQASALGFTELALYASGGVVLSLVTGCGLLAAWAFFAGAIYPAIGWAVACGVGWAFRRRFAAVLCAAGPAVLLGAELWALTGGLHERGAHGITALVDVRSFSGALFAAGVLSLTAGVFSMLPFPEFDGSHMFAVGLGLWRRDRPQAVHETAGKTGMYVAVVIAALACVLGVVG